MAPVPSHRALSAWPFTLQIQERLRPPSVRIMSLKPSSPIRAGPRGRAGFPSCTRLRKSTKPFQAAVADFVHGPPMTEPFDVSVQLSDQRVYHILLSRDQIHSTSPMA